MKRLLLASLISSILYSCAGDSFSFSQKTSLSNNDTDGHNPTITIVERKKLHVDEYMKWIEDKKNGLKVEKKINEITFSALFKPYEYIAIKELRKEALTKEELNKEINELNNLQYLTFRITAENKSEELIKMGVNSQEEYGARIEYFSFKMQDDMKLIDGNDTLDCLLFHFERVYGIAPYATFVLGFPLPENSSQGSRSNAPHFNNKTLVYEDRVFNIGKINLTINKEDLNNIPVLITD